LFKLSENSVNNYSLCNGFKICNSGISSTALTRWIVLLSSRTNLCVMHIFRLAFRYSHFRPVLLLVDGENCRQLCRDLHWFAWSCVAGSYILLKLSSYLRFLIVSSLFEFTHFLNTHNFLQLISGLWCG